MESTSPLAGRTLLVTGGAVRLGRALVTGLAARGATVHWTYTRSADESAALADELAAKGLNRGGRGFQADLTDEAELRAVAAAVGATLDAAAHPALDGLIHSAALFSRAPFAEAGWDEFTRLHAVNVRAPYFLTQALCARLQASTAPGGGAVVHISDIIGDVVHPNYSHYAPTKAALNMMTRALAVELAPRVRVNGIAISTMLPPETTPEAVRERLRARIPLGRFGEPDELVEAVAFLLTHAWTTGTTLTLDGGRSLS
jgi:pteridine reductase